MFCARLFICALWSPAGKGLTSWLSFVVSSVSLSLSHWYPGSGVVLDCIDSWSLQPYYFQHDLLVLNALSSDEDSGDSVQTCADSPSQSHCWVSQANVQTRHAFAARISDNPITIWSNTWHFNTVAKAQTKLSAQICRLAKAVVTSQCDKCQNLVLSQMAISVSFSQAENALKNRLT